MINGIITLYIFSAVFAMMVFVTWIFEHRERRKARAKVKVIRKKEGKKAA